MKSIILITNILLLVSCNSEEVSKPIIIKNKYPIEFVGKKVLEFTKPFVRPQGGEPIKEEVFAIYSITNKSNDTIWVETVPYMDGWAFKDTSIKIIYENRVTHHIMNRKEWMPSTDGWMWQSDSNGCWGGCNDSMRLYPNQAAYFIEGEIRYDSMQYDIVVKIKKELKIKDSIVTKKLILNQDHFVEDLRNWPNPFILKKSKR